MERYLVSVDFNLHKDKIRCGVITMDVGQIIVGRSWLFNKDVNIYGRSNMCQFEHKSEKIKLLLLRFKIKQPEQTPTAPKKNKKINLISAKVLDQKLKKGAHPFPSLVMLPTPSFLPPISTTLFFSLISLACLSHKPLSPLLLISYNYRVSESASVFTSLVHKLQKEISDGIEQSNVNYKLRADIRKNFKTFTVGDCVIVQIHSKRFPSRTIKKLHTHSAEPFKILNRLNDNNCIIDLFKDFSINYTFNVEDLIYEL